MKKALIAAGIVAVLAVVVFASVRQTGDDEGVEVDVAEVVREDISRIVKASGVIDPRVKVNISAHVIGKIERLYVEEGEWIEAGEPFLDLEKEAFTAARDDWRARLRRARTDVRKAEVELADSELKLRRVKRLAEEGIVSTERLEAAELTRTSAELGLEQARDAVEQAQANLNKALDDLDKTTIYAPLTGQVIALNAEEGEVVVSGTMNNPASIIGTIADLSELLAEVDVNETEIVYIETGQLADLEVDAVPEREYTGHVVEVGSSGFSRSQQPDVTFFKVKVLLDNPDEELLAGMSVRAEITTATHEDVPVIPIQAVVQRPPTDAEIAEGELAEDEEVPVVYMVADGAAERRRVATGISSTTRVEITAGLEAGEQVVIGPYRTLRELEGGDPVIPEEEDEDGDGDGP